MKIKPGALTLLVTRASLIGSDFIPPLGMCFTYHVLYCFELARKSCFPLFANFCTFRKRVGNLCSPDIGGKFASKYLRHYLVRVYHCSLYTANNFSASTIVPPCQDMGCDYNPVPGATRFHDLILLSCVFFHN